ncbi:MAG: molybdenum ABC transporter ATP-binding protein [Alphaproteobacteria bacterium]|nr:molybdenum ABC transporter ATP-binding protein [Alphaproteobacteria bacterium]
MSLEVSVEKSLGGFALNAAFSCGAGITALFGQSGSGKTSVINMIAGLLRPERGRITVDGRTLFDAAAKTNVPPHRRRIGYVFQDARLFPHLTVRQNLLYGRYFSPAEGRYATFDQVVELLGIAQLLDRRPVGLSGGEEQRVAIGRALLASPRILLMDEPLASLDDARKGEILPFIERLRDEMRLPILYVSHAMDEVARLADTMVLMANGSVVAVGSVEELSARADLPLLARRQEAGAVVHARVASHDARYGLSELHFDGGVLRVPRMEESVGAAVRLRIPARDVSLSIGKPGGTSVLNVLAGRVSTIALDDGPYAVVQIAVGPTALLARITRLSAEELDLHEGRDVYALVKSVALERRGP